MEKLSEKKWMLIKITDDFKLVRGRESNMATLPSGNVPLISAKNGSNGVKGFINTSKKLVKGECITLNNDGDGGAGLAYYQPFEMALDTHVTALLPKQKIYTDSLLFTSECLSGLHGFFGHGLSISNARAKNVKVMLPVNDSNKPDHEYMAEYVKQTREALLAKYRTYIEKRIAEIGKEAEIPTLGEKTWKPFRIEAIFEKIVPGKGHGLNHLTKVSDDGVNYIGATNRNNGVLSCVKKDESSERLIQPGNCVGFIKNGDGSAGFAIYKAERFISTSDVIYGYAKWLNCYTGLFFVATQDMIQHKYSHGYKRNSAHLLADRVMLPVNDADEPDYDYMEQYAKNMMLRKYKQYLAFNLAHNKEDKPYEVPSNVSKQADKIKQVKESRSVYGSPGRDRKVAEDKIHYGEDSNIEH